MAQYSLSLNGEEWTDNERLVDWQCSRCFARFETKNDVVAHIHSEHSSGTYYPRLNAQGIQMVVPALMVTRTKDPGWLAIFKESGVIPRSAFVGAMNEQEALKIVREHESEILSQMGMKAGIVEPGDVMPIGHSRGSQAEMLNGELVYNVAAVRDLLIAGFTVDDLRRLFLYTSNEYLKPLKDRFGSQDDLESMVEKTITYCQKQARLPDLLREVQGKNPEQYARFEAQLHVLHGQCPEITKLQAFAENELTSDERRLLETVSRDIKDHPPRGYALVDSVVRNGLGWNSRHYVEIAKGLIERGILEEMPPELVGRVTNIRYLYLRLTEKGQFFSSSGYRTLPGEPQSGQQLEPALQKWEAKRLKRKGKDDQYFLYKGVIHYLYEDAALLCDDIAWRWKEMSAAEDAVVFSCAPQGSKLDEASMLNVIVEIFSDSAQIAEGSLIILSARWGAGAVWDQVATALSARTTSEGTLEVQALTDILGDPIYGVEKTLRVIYIHDGRGGIKTVPENAWLRLP